MTKPITPAEAVKAHASTIPDAVLDVFNKLLAERFVDEDDVVNITQPEVVKLLTDAGLDRTEIFNKGWLDIEPIYRKAGWEVDFDKPGYCESYEANWTFSRKLGR